MKKRLIALLLAFCLTMGLGIANAAETEDPVFSNLDDLTAWLYYEQTYLLEEEIRFSYTSELDEVFSTPDPLSHMLYNCGLLDWTQYRNTEKRTVKVNEIDYYQGFKIAQSWLLGETDRLNAEEKTALANAQKWVEEARKNAQSPYQLALNLHDALVSRVTYEANDKDEWDYHDTAVGSLNYGKAECDGYSDAFYLLCTLAGLQSGFQYGTTDNADEDETHLWNVLFWDGWWYQVDVTWDDKDREDAPAMATYRYFNVGSEMMEDHFWDGELSPHNQAKHNNWNYFLYTHDNTGANGGAYWKEMKDAADFAVSAQKKGNHDSLHIMVNGRYEDGKHFNSVLQDAGLRGRWTTWTKRMGEYTCFDVLFVNE